MSRYKKIIIVFSLLLVFCACALGIKKLGDVSPINISEKNSFYMNNYIGLKQGGIVVGNKKLEGSTEGGEITRYEDQKGNVLRYRLIRYGETGKTEENYYFIENYAYYTVLEEMYDGHIWDLPLDILYRVFEEVMVIDGQIWRYGGIGEPMAKEKNSSLKISSLQELNQLYEEAELEN